MKALFLNFFKKLFLAFDLLFFSCFGKNAGKGIYFFACFVYTIGEEERKDMPAEYTHQLIAEQIYARLPEGLRQKISDLPSYFLGAQGADVFYFVNYSKKPNIGRFLHNRCAYEVFEGLLRAKDGSALSYAAGYIAHYAADTVFHPFVYALVQYFMHDYPQKNVRWHAYIESDLDTLFVRSFAGVSVHDYRCPVREGKADTGEIFRLMRQVCAQFGLPAFTQADFCRGVRRYLCFERAFTDARFRRRKVVNGVERLLHLPQVFSCIFRREEVDERVEKGLPQGWRNPSAPEDTPSMEDARQLFSRATEEGVRLISAFCEAREKKQPLPFAAFNMGHLSGIDCRLPFVRPAREKTKVKGRRRRGKEA